MTFFFKLVFVLTNVEFFDLLYVSVIIVLLHLSTTKLWRNEIYWLTLLPSVAKNVVGLFLTYFWLDLPYSAYFKQVFWDFSLIFYSNFWEIVQKRDEGCYLWKNLTYYYHYCGDFWLTFSPKESFDFCFSSMTKLLSDSQCTFIHLTWKIFF